jgi:hypothetical protein
MDTQTPINSMEAASAAVADWVPRTVALGGGRTLTVRKVKWFQLPELSAQFNQRVLEALASYGSTEANWGEFLSGAHDFCTRLIELSCRLDRGALEHLDLDWDAGALVVAAALEVNLGQLRQVRDFFSAALHDVLSVSPPSPDGSASVPPNADSA